MTFLLAPLALSLPLAALPAQTVSNPQQQDEIGLSMYIPRHGDAFELHGHIHNLRTIAPHKPGAQDVLAQTILIRDVIGMQGTLEQRERTRQMLDELDRAVLASLEASSKDVEPEPQQDEIRTLRLRSLDPVSAYNLVTELPLGVAPFAVDETGTLVLTGPPADLDAATAVILQADEPLPQVTIQCELVEAVRAGDGEGVRAEVAEALSAVVPGKDFAHRGRVLVRSSVGGGGVVTVSTELPAQSSEGGSYPPLFMLQAQPAGWDADGRILNLRSCGVTLSVPTYEDVEISTESVQEVTPNHSAHKAARAKRSEFTGYNEQTFMTDLALRADETTIVGSLGGAPYFLVMRVTVD